MAEADDAVDPYRILQVDPGADQDVIQAAYRALARQYHPDVAPDAETARRMATINAAFDLIRDGDRRAAFDRAHGYRRPADPPSPPGPDPTAASQAGEGPGEGSADAGAAPRPGPSWEGSAGPPPGRPSGSVLGFGRFRGWSLGEIARLDAGYLQWLDERREGQPYRAEIDELLRRMEVRKPPPATARRRGPFGRG